MYYNDRGLLLRILHAEFQLLAEKGFQKESSNFFTVLRMEVEFINW